MASAQDFQESDIIFSDNDGSHNFDQDRYLDNKENMQKHFSALCCSNNENHNNNNKKMARSLPVKIPEGGYRYVDSDGEFNIGKVVPPHVIVAMRDVAAEEIACVCCGNGGRLKGRDLSYVRNSVLRMTGFLEI